MPLDLGSGWASPPVVVHEPEVYEPSVDDLRTEQLLVAIETLKDALFNLPAPVVNVSEPDLSAIVTAVTSLKGSASAEDIARAVVNEISPGGEPGMDQVLGKLTEALERLDFRLKGIGAQSGGGVGVSDINDRVDRELGKVSVANFPASQKVQLDQSVSHYTSSTGALKVSQGKVWLAGSRQTVSLTVPTASIVMQNPSSSTKNMQVFHFNVTGTVAGDVDFFHTHSDISTFGAAVTPMNPNHYYDAATSSAVIRAGNGAPASLDVRSPIRRVNTQAPVEFEGLIILGPGHSFGLRVSGATGDGAFYMNARWIEE